MDVILAQVVQGGDHVGVGNNINVHRRDLAGLPRQVEEFLAGDGRARGSMTLLLLLLLLLMLLLLLLVLLLLMLLLMMTMMVMIMDDGW